RKTDKKRHNDQAQRPVWQFPCWESRRSELDDAAGRDDIRNRNAINLSPFHLLEKAAHKNVIHRVASRLSPRPIDNYARDLLKLNDFGADCEAANHHE